MNLLQAPINVLPDSIPSPKAELSQLSSMSIDDIMTGFVNSVVHFVGVLALAIIVFYLGKFIIKKIYGLTLAILHRRNVDPSLSTFILSLIKIVLYFILIVTVIGILGIETSSFLALFASAGVAIGMALSGTLQNFAGGVLILLLKPYKIGDYIEAQGFAGTVTEIQIFSTIICTPDNKSIIIPNGGLSTGSINNYSRQDTRRVDWTVSIAYGNDVDTARRAIIDMLHGDKRILDNETASEVAPVDGPASLIVSNPATAPVVLLSSLGDNSVNLTVRAWVKTADYWAVYFEYNERFYNELPKVGISFPFPQLDVHINPAEDN